MRTAIAKKLLRSLGLYRPVRLMMHRRFNRSVREEDQRSLAFYAQFIQKGDLVFDVGANIGRRCDVFVQLGARVIAVEPNPECRWQIREMFPKKSVIIEPVAVGEVAGKATLYLCESDRMSSLSDEWINRMRGSRFAIFQWAKSIMVDVVTLDALIAKHGVPKFIKIDTEGFEVQTLSGLSSPVPALSFEFSPECRDFGVRCVELLEQRGVYEYNVSLNDSMKFRLTQWMSADRMIKMLQDPGVWPVHNNGDIYARFRSKV